MTVPHDEDEAVVVAGDGVAAAAGVWLLVLVLHGGCPFT